MREIIGARSLKGQALRVANCNQANRMACRVVRHINYATSAVERGQTGRICPIRRLSAYPPKASAEADMPRPKGSRRSARCRGCSNFGLLGNGQSVIDVDPKVSHRAFDFRVP
jgi:hypothetical protein